MITTDTIRKILPNNKEPASWADALIAVLPRFDITTNLREAAFIAQCAHESLEFTVLKENLNYSQKGLLTVFPKYFNPIQAGSYSRNPQAIANRVYGNRMGNGPEGSGDGWKYRGRGLIQITGKKNYTACSLDLYGDYRLLENPDLVFQSKETAIETACWFWSNNQLNSFADAKDLVGMTRRINGGINGLDDRRKYYDRALAIL